MNSKERLLEYLKYLGIGQNAFENSIGVSVAYISKLKGSIGSEVLAKIKRTYPELSIDWLVDGDGEMIRQNVTQTNQHGDNINTARGSISINKQDDKLKEECERLRKENDRLKDELLKAKQTIIDLMLEGKKA